MIQLILEATVRSMALGLIVWLALIVTRARNPHLKKTVWTLVLGASLAMPFLMQVHGGPITQVPGPVVTLRPLAATASVASDGRLLLSGLYAAVALVMLCHLGLGLIRMRQICRKAHRIAEPWVQGRDVRMSASVTVPATFASTILLPEEFRDWSSQKLAAAIAHESAHVRARDCVLLWLARLNTCVFWFNPCAWWLERELTALAETTSDDAAWRVLGDGPVYAQILLDFAMRRPTATVATSMARSSVSSRIERIIAGVTPDAVPRFWRHLATAAAALPAIAVAAILQWSPVQFAQAAGPHTIPSERPRILNVGDLVQLLGTYYPPEARRRGIEGMVQIAVTLDAQGRATDTVVLYEDPPDMGFGAAASAATHTLEFANPTGHPVQFTFNVKFALQKDEVLTTDLSGR